MNNKIARGAAAKRSVRADRACGIGTVMESLESRTLLVAGALDQTFGRHGFVHLSAERPVELETVAAAALADGKTLVLGRERYPTADTPPFTLARLNVDGSPDVSFGKG